MKRLLVLVCTAILTLGCLTGCGNRETASSKENDYTQSIMVQSAEAVGYPDVSNFFEKNS